MYGTWKKNEGKIVGRYKQERPRFDWAEILLVVLTIGSICVLALWMASL